MDDSYWTFSEGSLDVIELFSINKVKLVYFSGYRGQLFEARLA